jgi:hypothetical protein
MDVSARIRFGLAAGVLATMYYFLLIHIIGWVMATHWPAWWFGAFPTRHIAGSAWLVTLHTIAVLTAALPVAIASVVIARKRAVLLGATAGFLATVVSILPSLGPTVWPMMWQSHPVFFITDQIKLVVAVPFVAWVILGATSNNRFERSRGSVFGKPGGVG